MTPEPCPECKGKCCRDSYRYKLTHMGDEFYEHVCEACYDGTKYVPPRTAEEERADIVRWLQQNSLTLVELTLGQISERIERGEHEGARNNGRDLG